MDHKLLSVHRIARRTALEIGLCLALAPRIAVAQTDPSRERPHEGDVLVAVGATPPKPLKPEELPLDGQQTFTWPMDPATGTVRDGSRLNKVLLLRLDPEGFDPETKGHAADGVVAYSSLCPYWLRRHRMAARSAAAPMPVPLFYLRSKGRSQGGQRPPAPLAGTATKDSR